VLQFGWNLNDEKKEEQAYDSFLLMAKLITKWLLRIWLLLIKLWYQSFKQKIVLEIMKRFRNHDDEHKLIFIADVGM